jgi:ubiquinol-cytochrome c reductase iron-sulfur subunit
MGASLIVFRMPPSSLRLPSGLRDFPADGGILAFSRICTHAGCAINMFRSPLFQPDEPKPALVCPCHYSTFDPATGGTVIFGPAGRPLPMLPIYADRNGDLRAKGNFNEPVGPSWWGVRMYRPNP